MNQNRSRLVATCQQLLAFGLVAVVAAPAANVVTLDIVAPTTGDRTQHSRDVAGGSLVASRPVTPHVREIPVGGVDPRGLRALAGTAASRRVAATGLAALTAPEPVTGYATVGVTWARGAVAGGGVTVSVRSLQNGRWSRWEDLPYDPEEGPDPDSAEGRNARPGTDAVVVGEVDDVQVRAVTRSGKAPAGMRLAVVDPGATAAPKDEQPAIDTAKLASAGTTTPGTPADVTPKPMIFSRAQWGADESMRDKSSLRYYEVHAGFVHHTVNANDYTRAEVPAIIRGIYAYHTQSRGWSDIGYNFLVDRFGRIWEGRFGGVDRPVVGAHTLGYNDYAFAMSAIGNYDTGHPSQAMLNAYGRLFAWKLSLHGVAADSTHQWVGKQYLPAINGHRDVGQTACPGKYLYAQIPYIRALAAQYQRPFASRAKHTDISGSRWPDLVVRDAVTKEGYLVRTKGQVTFASPSRAATGWGGMDLMTATRDVTGDGIPDMMARDASTGVTGVYPGDGHGGFGDAITRTRRFAASDQLTGVGDMTGDGNNDVVSRNGTTKRLYLFPGQGNGWFGKARRLSADWSGYNLTTGAGDLDGDGRRDLLARGSDNRLWLVPGAGHGTLATPVALPGTWGSYDLVTAMGDVTNDGHPDIVVRRRTSKLTYVYPGDGHGGLGTRYGPFTTFAGVDSLAVAGNIAGNRAADLVGRDSRGRLMAFANSGGRNIGSVVDTGTRFPGANLLLNVGDWNGDGHGDVMTRSTSGNLYLYEGDGKSHFAPPVLAATGWGSVRLIAAVGDITGDGFPDLMGQPSGYAMRIYPGNGSTGFRRSYVAHSAISSDTQVGVGLWDADGSPDSILRDGDGSLVVYPGNGPGGLTSGTKVGGGAAGYVWMQGSGDADGDGRPDIIARDQRGRLWLLPGNGSGFAHRRFIGDGFDRYDLGR